MKNISIEPFFLSLSITKLFPLVKFIDAGSLGKVYYADFEIPFSLNDEILSQIQEAMKGKIKENLECKVLEMLPKIAKDYLHHHAKKDLANLVDLGLPMLSIVQIGDFYSLSQDEVKNSPVTAHIKLFSSISYENSEGKKVTRIYGISAKDSKELKETFKEVLPFFKRDLIGKFRAEKAVDLIDGTLFLLAKGRAFKNQLIEQFALAVEPFSVQMAESLESQSLVPYGLVRPLPYQSPEDAPANESLLFGFLEPFFVVNHEIQGNIEEKVFKFCEGIFTWLNQYNFKTQKELEVGSEYFNFSSKLSQLSYFHVKNIKNKKKLQLKVELVHFLGLKVNFLKVLIEEKDLKNFLKIEAFFHPAALLAWIEEGKIAQERLY
jgi:hypothetical protein